jgi:prophage antirepressor-like protein
MMNLVLIRRERFGNVPCDFYRDEDGNTWMTAEQLGNALIYSEPRKAVGKLVERHEYLKSEEFAAVVKMTTPSGTQDTRVFSEDGIMEISMLARSPVAQEFRAWVRGILKAIHRGDLILASPVDNETERTKAETEKLKVQLELARERNVALQAIVQLVDGTGIPVTLSAPDAISVITNPSKLYSATEIAEELGTSPEYVGRIANAEGVRDNPEFGRWRSRTETGHKSRRFLYNERGRQRITTAYQG